MKMPRRDPAPIKFPLHLRCTHVRVFFASVENSVICLSPKRVLRQEKQLFPKRKSPNYSTVLVINFSINWIYLESTCLRFLQMPRKTTKFVLNNLFENMNFFWKSIVFSYSVLELYNKHWSNILFMQRKIFATFVLRLPSWVGVPYVPF